MENQNQKTTEQTNSSLQKFKCNVQNPLLLLGLNFEDFKLDTKELKKINEEIILIKQDDLFNYVVFDIEDQISFCYNPKILQITDEEFLNIPNIKITEFMFTYLAIEYYKEIYKYEIRDGIFKHIKPISIEIFIGNQLRRANKILIRQGKKAIFDVENFLLYKLNNTFKYAIEPNDYDSNYLMFQNENIRQLHFDIELILNPNIKLIKELQENSFSELMEYIFDCSEDNLEVIEYYNLLNLKLGL